jgi:mono/diheme cytochrome c family protein
MGREEMALAKLVRRAASWTLSATMLASCGGSGVGDQQEPQPEAVAVVIGQDFTSTSAGVQTKVRSGTEVMLSGKESRKGDDDTGLPIITYRWEQTSSGTPVQLVERSSHTVSFSAPRVVTPTTLTFRMTVADAKGQTDTTDVSVQVEPIRDPDRFLEYIEASDEFEVVAATTVPIAADATSSATDVIPFTITMTKLVSFTDRDRVARENVAVGEPVIFRGQWERRAGSSNSCDAAQNPRIRLQIPRLDLDDLISGSNALLSDRMEASDVDGATVSARIEISTSVAMPGGATPTLCVNALPATGSATPVGSSVERPVESLTGAGGRHDDRVTAQAYYDTIDPATGALKKDTLRKWLTANGFNASAEDYGADAHAVYVNNYDLGFGRDMYMKQGACDTNTASLPLSQRAGHCDMAFVVVNYTSLENAARRISPILAVAMEYSAASPGGERFTKFYTFAPDRRDGEFKRVLSANLDGRGEKYMPQGCVTCHGGVPGGVDSSGAYANSGNVHAAFLSWDLNALLFSDTDPSFTRKTRYVSLRNAYTRASQEAPLKALNAGAYLTLKDPQAMPGRFALARELVEGWYGGPELPSASFNTSYTPAGWQVTGLDGIAGTNDDNPSTAATMYQEVFGPHCRACHVYQIPTADPRVAALCNNDASDDASVSVSSPDQLPIGCYRQLVAAPLLSEVLNDARMPLARLTLDRFWTPPATGASPGQKLATHLADFGISVAAPGSQRPCIDPFGTEVQENGVTKHRVARGEVIRLTTECSHVLSGEQWSLQSPSSSRAVLTGNNTTSPAFTADRQGDYVVTLRDAAGSTATITATIPVEGPTVGSGSRNVVLFGSGAATIDVNVTALAGFRAPDAIASIEVLTQSGVTATVLDPTSLRLSTSTLAGGTATYRVTDIDGEVSNVGTITLSVSAAIAANDATVDAQANGGVTVNLASLVSVPPGEAFSLTINQQPTRNRGRGTGSASAPSGGQTNYTAPLGVLSHFGSIQVDLTDSFEYRACFVAQPATCDTGTITVRLNGTRSFANVSTNVLSNCASGCHDGPPAGAALLMSNAISSKQLYCNIRTGTSIIGGSGTEAAGTPYVNIVVPASSLFYRKPSGLDGHGGGAFASVAAVILDWLNEGAYFTEGANQSCPP